ncbi:O-methyltransferase [Reticulibacter mediterranei]|uniref:O-methyltransferase n=1 Tax=Reticulibacter mediterranei TaxID=2778369 RepID=A0A8J3N6V6_9CHLR|nr:O-methyltransferase [Reticulibacter mediterranei]GHO97840.1 O-methyltransferase [Reticulibacter mediterranei]
MSLALPGDEQARAAIMRELESRFAPEDEALRNNITRTQEQYHHSGQITPLQGKLFQVLALTCGARKILEIGTMTGYSGVWLARGLTSGGKLITLEAQPDYAETARTTFAEAGISDRVEIRIGAALDLLPALVAEAPFDLIFIDADKVHNPQYLDWALRLSRAGSLIIADNIVRGGQAFQTPPPNESAAGVAAYTRIILEHPRLVSVALSHDDMNNGIDGYSISVVLEE